MRIEELHLKNFRCFKELDIQFPESNLAVFIGLNGAGKSAILDAIISSLLNLSKTHGIIEFTQSEQFSDDDIAIESEELNANIKINCNSCSVSWDIFKERDKSKKIQNIEGERSNFEKEVMGSPNFTITQYTAKREKKFVHLATPHLVTIDFDVFKKNFIKEVDAENRVIIENKSFDFTNPNLNVIRKAIETFCSNISNMYVSDMRTKDINGNTNIVMNWNDLELTISQLSEGQRNLLLLISDISYSLLTHFIYPSYSFNKNPIDVLKRNGIVLIDEIELHLHPQWQREVLPALQKTFPNIQFIVTTHSPQVLSNLKKEEVFILKDNKIVEVTPHIEGRDSNSILYELFGVEERHERFKNKLKQLYNAIDDENLSEAKEILAELTAAFGEQDTEIVRANLHLSFAEE